MKFTPWKRGPGLFERLLERAARYFANNLHLALEIDALRESVSYIRERLPDAVVCNDRRALHRLALERVTIEGLFLELGVKRGGSIRDIAGLTDHTIHGFDSFQGLPEDWGGTTLQRGRFSTGGKLPDVPRNVRLHPGWFKDSLPRFAAEHPEPVAFMHVDCDLYSSTRTVFECLGNRIVPGTVIVFDEYFNHPNWRDHEYKAFQEFVAAQRIEYRYLAFTARGGAVALAVTARS
jgi:hypothetical protein